MGTESLEAMSLDELKYELEIAEGIRDGINEMMVFAAKKGLIDLWEMEHDRLRDAQWYVRHVRELIAKANGGSDAKVPSPDTTQAG